MNERLEQLMQAALDGELSAEAQTALNQALRSDPAALETYCRMMRVDALLAWRTGDVTSGAAETKAQAILPKRSVLRWAGWAAAALVAAAVFFFSLTPNTASAAVSRMLAAMQRGDRTYKISVLEGDPHTAMNNGRTMTHEGAVLHLRNDRQFVLVRPIIEGGQRITGTDGTLSWELTDNGPVKVSRDPARFRGGLPGEQQDAPFLDLAGQLTALRSGYTLTLSGVSGQPSLSLLTAVKKSRDVRGPREMAITFRRDTGVITLLELRGLPRARGGAEAVRLTLTSEASLSPDFFTHTPHHEPERRVENADDSGLRR